MIGGIGVSATDAATATPLAPETGQEPDRIRYAGKTGGVFDTARNLFGGNVSKGGGVHGGDHPRGNGKRKGKGIVGAYRVYQSYREDRSLDGALMNGVRQPLLYLFLMGLRGPMEQAGEQVTPPVKCKCKVRRAGRLSPRRRPPTTSTIPSR